MLVDVEANGITGIIAWTDAAIAADRERAAFHARRKLLEDIAYGLSTPGAHRYGEAGLTHLTHTFGDPA